MRMRTWTLVAAGLVLASVGATATMLPDLQPTAGQQDQQESAAEPQDQQKKKRAGDAGEDGMGRDVQRRLEVLGGRDVQIGVTIRDLEGDRARTMTGAVVSEVREDSPAAKAGFKQGDVIVEFDGEKVRSARHLSRVVGETAAGHPVKAVVARDGTRTELEVTPEASMAFDGNFRFRRLPNRDFEFNGPNFRFDGPAMRELFEEHGRRGPDGPDVMVLPPGRGRLGIGIQDLSPQLAEYFGTKDGVLVTSVDQDSPAAKAGLKAGDVITAIGDTPVGSPSDLTRAVRRAEGTDLSITYTRDKKSATTKATIEPRARTGGQGI
jgi:membrane-associated protease RseP (regulator of RpoE activity)